MFRSLPETDISRYCSERTSRRTALRHLSCSKLDDPARRIDTAILRRECRRQECPVPDGNICKIIERLSDTDGGHQDITSPARSLPSPVSILRSSWSWRGEREHAVVDCAANLPCCLRFNCDPRLVNKHASGTARRRSRRQMEILCGPAGPPAGY